jgi:sporulation protein YlmC with PRC-barrel domain
MQLTSLTGHPVISRADADELGRLDTVVIDPDSHAVRAYRLMGTDEVLPVEATNSVGADALMVEDGALLRPPHDDIERRAVEGDLQVLGARVLSDHGNELGTLNDLDFDPETGRIETLAIGSMQLPGDDLVGIGRYAVMVRDPNPDEDVDPERAQGR